MHMQRTDKYDRGLVVYDIYKQGKKNKLFFAYKVYLQILQYYICGYDECNYTRNETI